MVKKEMKEQDVQESKQSDLGKCFYFRHRVKPRSPLHKREASACVCVKSNTSPWVFCKWYKILALSFHKPSTKKPVPKY